MSQFFYVGRYTIQEMTYVTRGPDGQPVPPDLNPQVSMHTYSDGVELFSRMADPGTFVGEWIFTISSVESSTPGIYYLLWNWLLDGVPQIYRQDLEVPNEPSVAYQALSPEARHIVDRIWVRLADLFDSALGGPHLQEYAQTNFGRDRIAQLMQLAMNRITSRLQQPQQWNLYVDEGYPYAEWSGLLEQSLWIETLKHLHRSYIEQPTPQGVPVARLDRTEYYRRWAEVISLETGEFNEMLDVFKLSLMGLGNVAVIVAGGVFGKMQPPLNMPARGRRMVQPPRFW
jgi:hypothetical protein